MSCLFCPSAALKVYERLRYYSSGVRPTDDTDWHYFNEAKRYLESWKQPQTTTINKVAVLDQRNGECGNKTTEEEYIETLSDYTEARPYKGNSTNQYDNYAYHSTVYILSTEAADAKQNQHECVCGYWYNNVVKDEYKYAIIDLPRDREVPANYKQVIAAGVQAGLDRWGDLNDIDFIPTDSRLEADIIIQQQIGDNTAYGNAEMGCLFDSQQCTIQLFSDLNVGDKQTLLNAQSIDWTIAHEFGHLIGLPHHIDPGHVMNTNHANNIRTYYEVRGINTPIVTEPTYQQRMLTDDELRSGVYDPAPDAGIANIRAEYDGIYDRLLAGDGTVDDLYRLFEIIEMLFEMLSG